MDGSAAVIILIFLVTILSSGGDRAAKHSSPSPAPITSPRTVDTQNFVTPVPNYIPYSDQNLENRLSSFILANNKKLSQEDTQTIVACLVKYGQQYNINPRLVAAMISKESGFNPGSVSYSGAQGLAQLMPSTAQHIGIDNPFDLDQGVKGAALYLKMMMDRFPSDQNQISLALASYKEGPNAVARSGGNFADDTKLYIEQIIEAYNLI